MDTIYITRNNEEFSIKIGDELRRFTKKETLKAWIKKTYGILDKEQLKCRMSVCMPYGFKGDTYFKLEDHEVKYRQNLINHNDIVKEKKQLSDKLRFRNEDSLVKKLKVLNLQSIINESRMVYIEGETKIIKSKGGVTGLSQENRIVEWTTILKKDCTKFVLKEFLNSIKTDPVNINLLEAPYRHHFTEILSLWSDQRASIPRTPSGHKKHEVIEYNYKRKIAKVQTINRKLQVELSSSKSKILELEYMIKELRDKLHESNSSAVCPSTPVHYSIYGSEELLERKRKIKEQKERMAKMNN
tara:strand:- start:1198 stop:2097 length:900 start_codon:yes stop_codon:yes gene_type:complete